jgi:hypothetical protein
MKNIILTVLSSLIFCVSIQAQSKELKVYIEPSTITQTDHGNKGYSVGDVVTRHGKVFFEDGGPVVGEYFTQAKLPTFIVTKKRMLDFL